MPKPKDDEINEFEAKLEKERAEAMLSDDEKAWKAAALKVAKKLEKEDLPSKEDLSEEMHRFAAESEDAKKLLTPLSKKKTRKKSKKKIKK